MKFTTGLREGGYIPFGPFFGGGRGHCDDFCFSSDSVICQTLTFFDLSTNLETAMSLSEINATVLCLLDKNRPLGLYGSDLIQKSNGELKRGSVYTILSRLEKQELVESLEEPATDQESLPRIRYRITERGTRVRMGQKTQSYNNSLLSQVCL